MEVAFEAACDSSECGHQSGLADKKWLPTVDNLRNLFFGANSRNAQFLKQYCD